MTTEEAIEKVRAVLDYEWQNDRWDDDTLNALIYLVELAENNYHLRKNRK